MSKDLIEKLKKDSTVTLHNEQLDAFFHGNVLKRYLNRPMWDQRDILIKVYNNFKRHFEKDCIYRIANIQRLGRAFFINVLFHTNQQRKYMLSMVYSHFNNLSEQKEIIYNLLHSEYGAEISDVSIPEEDLPSPIGEMIKDLLSRKVNPLDLRLRKIIGKEVGDPKISFHDLQYLMDRETRTGISILAGFQY